MGFYRDMALDLGTAAVRGAARGRGMILREPTLAAADRRTGEILAVGQAAREMLDRAPGTLAALRPIQGGAVTDGRVVRTMIQTFLQKALGRGLTRPRLLLSVPTGLSPVERQALTEAALQAGAGKVCLMASPLAAALGEGLDPEGPEGQLAVCLGAGVTDGAVLALGRVMAAVCIPAAGDKLEEALLEAVRRDHQLVLGRRTAGLLKETMPPEGGLPAAGQCLTTGLPREVLLTPAYLREAFRPVVEEITGAIGRLLEQTPPELARDAARKGILLTGGGCHLPGLPEAIGEAAGIPVRIAPDPELSVIQGLEAALPRVDWQKDGLDDLTRHR